MCITCKKNTGERTMKNPHINSDALLDRKPVHRNTYELSRSHKASERVRVARIISGNRRIAKAKGVTHDDIH